MSGPFQIVSDMYDEELEAFHLLHCGPVDVNRGVILLSPLRQGPHLLPVGGLVIVGNQSYYRVSSANLMLELEACGATQSW